MSDRIATAHEHADRAGSQPKALRVRCSSPIRKGVRYDPTDGHCISIATNAKRLQREARISFFAAYSCIFARRWTEMFSTT
jgi:hypothetical protein